MKSLFNTYTTALLLLFATAFTSCNTEMVEPMQTTSTEANLKLQQYNSGDYIVMFQNDSTLNLNTDDDIKLLAKEIGNGNIDFADIYNFEGVKGFTGFLNKQQVYSFYTDSRVFIIEPDSPIVPAITSPITEPELAQEINI